MNNCIVITNFSRKYNKDVTNTCWNISNIYYIVTDYSLDRLAYKYLQHAKADLKNPRIGRMLVVTDDNMCQNGDVRVE